MKNFTKKTKFISVEIVLKSNHSCNKFIKWYENLDSYVLKLNCETHKWYVYFAPTGEKTPCKTIRKFCKEIASLPKDIKKEWDNAEFKEFNIGYSIGEEPFSFLDNLSSKTIKKVNKLKAGIGISLYAAEPSDEAGIPQSIYEKD